MLISGRDLNHQPEMPTLDLTNMTNENKINFDEFYLNLGKDGIKTVASLTENEAKALLCKYMELSQYFVNQSLDNINMGLKFKCPPNTYIKK